MRRAKKIPAKKSNIVYFPIRHNFQSLQLFAEDAVTRELGLKKGDAVIVKTVFNPSEINNKSFAVTAADDGNYSIARAISTKQDEIVALVVDYRRAA